MPVAPSELRRPLESCGSRSAPSAQDISVPPLRIAFACAGLGVVRRGYETSTVRFVNALRTRPGLETTLFTSRGFEGGTPVFSIKRSLLWTAVERLGLAVRPVNARVIPWGMALEQLSFGLALLTGTNAPKHDVIWTKEPLLADFLASMRRFFGYGYSVIWADGGGDCPKRFGPMDRIQKLHPQAYDAALAAGWARDRAFMLPNCVPPHVPSAARTEIRRQFGYGDSDYLVLCVAAFNRGHKRIDYVMEEIAAIRDSNVKLCLCGQSQPGSEQILERGRQALGPRLKWFTISEPATRDLISACDVLVLASRQEAFGNALVEGAQAGVPVISHDHPSARFILGDDYWYSDLSDPGALSALLSARIRSGYDPVRIERLRGHATRHFAPESIAAQFEEIVREIRANCPLPGGPNSRRASRSRDEPRALRKVSP